MPDVRLIDANALLETICKKCPEYDCKPDATNTVSGCLIYDVIESAPTIDAQPVKRGKWIIYNLYAKCSECSVAYDFDTFHRLTPMNESVPRHCTYCGADMRGECDGERI